MSRPIEEILAPKPEARPRIYAYSSDDKGHAGLVTLPAEAGLERETLEIARRWQADAVRNSDGTQLSDEMRKAAFEVYSTVCFIREDQTWARAHRGELIQRYLLSPAVTAVADMVEIDLLKPYSHDNTRLLDRILFWAAGREEEQRCWSSSNPGTECAFYPETNRLVVVNNTGDEQRTTILGDRGRSWEISLQPYQSIWMTGA